MNRLPAPPDAYWAQVPWWGYLGFVLMALIVMFVLAPWMIQRARSRPSAMLSREQALALRETEARERENAERERIVEDRERGWGLARGCLPMMHSLWHDLDNVTQERNALLFLLRRVLDGKVLPDAARDRLLDFPDRERPAALPDLDGVEPKRPGETKYA